MKIIILFGVAAVLLTLLTEIIGVTTTEQMPTEMESVIPHTS